MKKTLTALAVIILAAIIVSAFLPNSLRAPQAWRVFSKSVETPSTEPKTVKREPSSQAASSFAASESQSRLLRAIKMPPADASVVKTIAALESAAMSGNAAAACRIAVDLQACSGARAQRDVAAVLENAMAKEKGGAVDSTVNLAANLLNSADRMIAKCEGTEHISSETAFKFQSIAAQRGGRAQARWLAVNPALDRNNFINQLDAWQQYRDLAKNYFSSALHNPSTKDLLPLLMVYAPKNTHIPRPPYQSSDPAMFLALYDIALSQGITLPDGITDAANALIGKTTPAQEDLRREHAHELDKMGWSTIGKPAASDYHGLLATPTPDSCF